MLGDIDLGKQLETFVDELIAAGKFGSRAEVLKEGVRLVRDRESRTEALDAALRRGLDDSEHGRLHDADEVFEELEQKYRAMAEPTP